MGKQFDDVSYGDVDAYIANYFMIGYDPDEADPADQTKRLGLDTLFSIVNAPAGYLFNGYISVTVSNDDLIVAIKGLDGNDPSSTNPVRVRIGNVEHTITAALSVTAADGTNWCNAGSSAFATLSVPYFVYLGYNVTDGVVIGFSRIPWAGQYSDFSATATDEKFCKISTITNASASDVYQNIGYFQAILSAGAGYTWSSPTGILSRPTYESNVVSYAPTLSGFSGTPTVTDALYQVRNRWLRVVIYNAAGTSNATTFTVSSPFTAASSPTSLQSVAGYLVDNSSALTAAGRSRINASTATIDLFTNMSTGTWTASGTKSANFSIEYRIG